MFRLPLISISCLSMLCSPIHATEENLVGVYSNRADGFRNVTIILGKSGSGDLMHSVGSSPIWEWNYDAKESIVTITGPLGDNNKEQSVKLIYDKATKTLAFEKKADSKLLTRIDDVDLAAHLSLFDVTASPDVIDLAKKEALTRGFDKDHLHILSLNPSHAELAKQLKGQGFETKDGDELVQIQGKDKTFTLQYRKNNDKWQLIHAHEEK